MKLTSGTLTPAYGRDYKSADAAIADFEAGKDFQFHQGLESGYVGKSDFAPGARINIRYGKLRKVTSYQVKA
jgi:hypothetical protein